MNEKIAKLSRTLTELHDIINEQKLRVEEVEQQLAAECLKAAGITPAAAPAEAKAKATKSRKFDNKQTGCSNKIRSLLALRPMSRDEIVKHLDEAGISTLNIQTRLNYLVLRGEATLQGDLWSLTATQVDPAKFAETQPEVQPETQPQVEG